ncbi:MAG: hypothetical protein ACT4QD_09715 [Acidobacteriota bacterium]
MFRRRRPQLCDNPLQVEGFERTVLGRLVAMIRTVTTGYLEPLASLGWPMVEHASPTAIFARDTLGRSRRRGRLVSEGNAPWMPLR